MISNFKNFGNKIKKHPIAIGLGAGIAGGAAVGYSDYRDKKKLKMNNNDRPIQLVQKTPENENDPRIFWRVYNDND